MKEPMNSPSSRDHSSWVAVGRTAALALAVTCGAAMAQSVGSSQRTITGGDEDNFANSGGIADVIVMRPAFEAWLNRPGGNNAVYHLGVSQRFDTSGTLNWEFGYSFMGVPQISQASLTFHVRSTGNSQNDLIALQFDAGTTRFSWSSRFSALELLVGGNGSWDNGDEMTVTLDLGALPSGTVTDLLPSINANGYLDVRVSDDTDVDFVRLSYGEVTQPGPTFSGLAHRAVGNATLNLIGGQLAVANIGASGTDGVEIQLPPVKGPTLSHAMLFAPVDPAKTAPVGAFVEATSWGVVNGLVQSVGSLRAEKTASGGLFSADYSSIGATGQRVEAYNGGQLVFSGTGVSPTVETSSFFFEGLFRGCPPDNWSPSWEFSWSIDIHLEGSSRSRGAGSPGGTTVTVTADEVHFIAEGVANPPTGLTSTILRAQGIPTLTLTSEKVSGFFAGQKYGTGLGGANTLDLSGSGSTGIGQTFVATTKNLNGALVHTLLSAASGSLSMLGGTLLVDIAAPMVRLRSPAVGGEASLPLLIPSNPSVIGLSVYLQSIELDPAQPSGVAMSNGLQLPISQ